MDSPNLNVTVSHINKLRVNVFAAPTVAQYKPLCRDSSELLPYKSRATEHGKGHQPHKVSIEDNSDSGLPSVVQDSQDLANIKGRIPNPINPRFPDAIKRLRVMNTQGDLTNSTQPISQSFYEPFIRRSKRVYNEIENENSTTQRTYEEGETGHVDITSSFVTRQAQPDYQDQTEDLADSEPVDFSQPQTQPRLTQFSESQRFKTPAAETPAVAGRKRTYNGDIIDTPAPARNPLVQNGQVTPAGLLGLSQAFAATQAASSPISNGLPTGPRSDRPSPNIDLRTRPAPTSSSPLMRPISNFRRTATEPAERYVPMKLSQAERQRHDLNKGRLGSNTVDTFDSFSEVDSVIAQERRRQDRRGKAERELKSLSSPIIPPKEYIVSSPPKLRPATTSEDNDGDDTESVHTSSPGFDKDLNNDISDDIHEPLSEAETEQDEDDGVDVEHSSQVLRHDEEDKENHSVLVPKTGPRHKFGPERNSSQIDASPSLRHGAHGVDVSLVQDVQSSDPLRIMDSQPSQIGIRYTNPSKNSTNTTSDVIDFEEQLLQRSSTGVSQMHRRKQSVESGIIRPRLPSIGELTEVEETSSNHKSTGKDHTIPETVSDIRAGVLENNSAITSNETANKQSLTVTTTDFETAPTHVDQVPTLVSSQVSSPVRHTPPGRKRMRMLEISAEPSPRRSQSQLNFDAGAVLQLDEDHVAAAFLQSSPSRAVRTPRSKTAMVNGLTTRRHESELKQQSSQPLAMNVEHDVSTATRDHDSHDEVYVSPELSQDIVKPGRQRRSQQLTGTLKKKNRLVETHSATRHSIYDIQLSPERPAVVSNFEQQPRIDSKARKLETKPRNIMHESRMMKRLQPASVSTEKAVSPPRSDTADALKSSPPMPLAEEASGVSKDVSEEDIVARQMVFAYYRGEPRGYYPARLISGSDNSYLIQWEGYDPSEVDAYGIKALDLRIGDTVKVLAAGFAKIPYIIRGFKDHVRDVQEMITDIRGYRKLIIVPKKRESVQLNDVHIIECEVPVASIYLDTKMWAQMKTRTQDFVPMTSLTTVSGAATPLELTSTPNTPSSKGRRPLLTCLPTPVLTAHGLLSNMSFAISYDDTNQKNSISNLIQANGGLIHDSFDDLLDPMSMELKAQYNNIGFTALLADRHSRKEKYMQALALGLPSLSGKWVETCVKRKELVDWQNYLLPAGESAELDNATRSRVLPSFDIRNAKLSRMLASRPNVFGGMQVIIVVARGKAEIKRAPYLFLIRALGATDVHKVADLNAAKDLLQADKEGTAQWVFVDDKDIETMQALIDDDNGSAKKAEGRSKSRRSNVITHAQCKVAGNELIVQSLILGRLYEP